MANEMTFDEFSGKLRKIRAEFKISTGREMKTIQELEEYLDKRLAKPKRSGARSLRGLSMG